jgi:hypothetical protein
MIREESSKNVSLEELKHLITHVKEMSSGFAQTIGRNAEDIDLLELVNAIMDLTVDSGPSSPPQKQAVNESAISNRYLNEGT